MNWRETTAEHYEEMLGCLPPRTMSAHGFLVGEPSSHRRCTVTGEIAPDWAAFVQVGGNYYCGPNLTFMEYRELHVEEIPGQAKAAAAASVLTPVAEIPAYAVIIRAVHERGPVQTEALEELKRRGLWLDPEQMDQAGLDRAP